MIFLGIALILSAVYISFLRRTTTKKPLLPTGVYGTLPERRLKVFFEWTFAGVLDRAWALRMAVVSLGFGVMLLPLPFVAISSEDVRGAVFVGALVLVIWGAVEIALRRDPPDYAPPSDPPATNPPATR